MYVDETGNLDYDGGHGKQGASAYFGFGSATFEGHHGDELFAGLELRAAAEAKGLTLPHGYHAVNDSGRTRDDMFKVIAAQAPRFDTTFLCKANAYPWVRERGEMYLYKMAWYQHFKEIATRVSKRNDTLYVIAGEFGTAARRNEAKAALADVCRQVDRNITLCVWQSRTSWGLQVADYGLWSTQRVLEGRSCVWHETAVKPNLETRFLPWGTAK